MNRLSRSIYFNDLGWVLVLTLYGQITSLKYGSSTRSGRNSISPSYLIGSLENQTEVTERKAL